MISYRVVFFTGTPQFQYQKENPPSDQSRPFLVTGFTGTAALIGWLAVFYLVLKMGGTSEKKHPVLACVLLCYGVSQCYGVMAPVLVLARVPLAGPKI